MRFPKFYRAALLTALFCVVAGTTASAGPARQKVDRLLRRAVDAGGGTQDVIITVNPGCRGAVRDAMSKHGDAVDGEHDIIDAVTGRLHSHDVDELAKSPCVKTLSANAWVHADGTARNSRTTTTIVDTTPVVTSTLRDTLGLPHFAALNPAVPTGYGVGRVAVIDSGIAPVGDFGRRIDAFFDFTRGGRATTPYDDFGHGTHIAGLIGSSGKQSAYEFQGVAPDVRFVGLKVLDRTGAGRTSDVIAAIEFAVRYRDYFDIRVINLSLGHPIYAPAADDPLVRAVEHASAAGIIVVASAGNNGQKSDGTAGYAGITSPGNAPSAITVGAANTHDTVTRLDDDVPVYSSRGPTWFDAYAKPDVVAPGHHLTSDTTIASYLYTQLQKNHVKSPNGEPLLSLSGSSMAAAVTTGVVALVLQAHQEKFGAAPLTPNLVKGILQFSAIPIAGADTLTQGTGEINADGAVALARAINTTRPLGAKWLQPVTPVSVIGGMAYFWSRDILYGNVLRSGDLLAANNIVWSSNIVWGASLEDDNIVWGSATEEDNIVWGSSVEDDNIVWGSNIVWSNRVIGQRVGGTNVVWGANIVWGSNIVWSTMEDDNIVWGTMTEDDNIVWGTSFGNDVVWGQEKNGGRVVAPTSVEDDNVVWGTGGGR
jgi:serine protease AprX